MLDSIVITGANATGAAIAGVSAALSLGLLVLAQVDKPPSPCWTRSQCGIKKANPDACETCVVYLRACLPELQIQKLPELGELRSASTIGAE